VRISSRLNSAAAPWVSAAVRGRATVRCGAGRAAAFFLRGRAGPGAAAAAERTAAVRVAGRVLRRRLGGVDGVTLG